MPFVAVFFGIIGRFGERKRSMMGLYFERYERIWEGVSEESCIERVSDAGVVGYVGTAHDVLLFTFFRTDKLLGISVGYALHVTP